MSRDDEGRYQEIKRRIQQRKQTSPPADDGLAAVLDELNIFGYLDDMRSKLSPKIRCYGPKIVRRKGWMGVVVWHRQRGYSTSPVLHLFGIWAVGETETPTIAIGAKMLLFSAPVYNAESYHKLIKRGFDVYYDDDGCPPPESLWRYSAVYDPAKRLVSRKAIEAELARWVGEQ